MNRKDGRPKEIHPWTGKDLKKLRHLYLTDVPVESIAEALHRTYQAVTTKLNTLGLSNARELGRRLAWAEKRIAELEAREARQPVVTIPHPSKSTRIAMRLGQSSETDGRAWCEAMRREAATRTDA